MELQEKRKPLTGSHLKLIAVFTMLTDHSYHVLDVFPWFRRVFLETGSEYQISVYFLTRIVGRMAFPVFAFLLTEGFQYTHNRKKYAGNLLLFALISEIPWNLIHSGTWHYKSQNVFFTLFLGLMCMIIYETYQEDRKKQLCFLGLIAVTAIFLKADYGLKGVGCIFALYLLRKQKVPQMFITLAFLHHNIFFTCGIAAAFVPISCYNQERGFIRGKIWKYAFYAFYPVHMLVLYFIRKNL